MDEWLRDHKIEEGYGPWSQPMFAIKKKSGAWRGVVDFRALNAATENDSHPIPRIEDILIEMGDRHLYTLIDLKDAFHQIPLKQHSRAYTCTSTPKGTFQWRVMAQGLKNGPSTFQRVVDWVLEPVADVAKAYFDDIIIGTKDQEGEDLYDRHLKDIHRVMECLHKNDLVADQKKCDMFIKKVEFCGHV